MKSAVLLLSSSLALASAFCDHGTRAFNRRAEPSEKVKFGYEDLLGPVVWQGIDEQSAVCATGRHQSPISISQANSKAVQGSRLNFTVESYPNGAEFLNLGTTLEVLANGTMALGDKDYSLVQYHVHTPSEHRINREYYPMEVHFVFQAEDDSLAVVGIMVEVASEEQTSDFVSATFANLDKAPNAGSVTETPALDFGALQAHINNSTEGVAWNVVEKPVFMNTTLYREIKNNLKFNSRFTQNEPGAINLLDQARLLLNGQVKPGSNATGLGDDE
ncbi:hypothetical protein NLU13_8066 [Sarocladium strictum]|uniref:Carbonic anhydrase n=1 Tax=Sarocladium strictum TaxID=5046 RepID=A0AA39GAY5_SARSR|nr:hypothetical protein NLU13_8066 [Sarocladium strictum]